MYRIIPGISNAEHELDLGIIKDGSYVVVRNNSFDDTVYVKQHLVYVDEKKNETENNTITNILRGNENSFFVPDSDNKLSIGTKLDYSKDMSGMKSGYKGISLIVHSQATDTTGLQIAVIDVVNAIEWDILHKLRNKSGIEHRGTYDDAVSDIQDVINELYPGTIEYLKNRVLSSSHYTTKFIAGRGFLINDILSENIDWDSENDMSDAGKQVVTKTWKVGMQDKNKTDGYMELSTYEVPYVNETTIPDLEQYTQEVEYDPKSMFFNNVIGKAMFYVNSSIQKDKIIRAVNFKEYSKVAKLSGNLTGVAKALPKVNKDGFIQDKVKYDGELWDLKRTALYQVGTDTQFSWVQDRFNPDDIKAFAVDVKVNDLSEPFTIAFSAPILLGLTFNDDNSISVHCRDRTGIYNNIKTPFVGKMCRFLVNYEKEFVQLYINGVKEQIDTQNSEVTRDRETNMFGIDVKDSYKHKTNPFTFKFGVVDTTSGKISEFKVEEADFKDDDSNNFRNSNQYIVNPIIADGGLNKAQLVAEVLPNIETAANKHTYRPIGHKYGHATLLKNEVVKEPVEVTRNEWVEFDNKENLPITVTQDTEPDVTKYQENNVWQKGTTAGAITYYKLTLIKEIEQQEVKVTEKRHQWVLFDNTKDPVKENIAQEKEPDVSKYALGDVWKKGNEFYRVEFADKEVPISETYTLQLNASKLLGIAYPDTTSGTASWATTIKEDISEVEQDELLVDSLSITKIDGTDTKNVNNGMLFQTGDMASRNAATIEKVADNEKYTLPADLKIQPIQIISSAASTQIKDIKNKVEATFFSVLNNKYKTTTNLAYAQLQVDENATGLYANTTFGTDTCKVYVGFISDEGQSDAIQSRINLLLQGSKINYIWADVKTNSKDLRPSGKAGYRGELNKKYPHKVAYTDEGEIDSSTGQLRVSVSESLFRAGTETDSENSQGEATKPPVQYLDKEWERIIGYMEISLATTFKDAITGAIEKEGAIQGGGFYKANILSLNGFEKEATEWEHEDKFRPQSDYANAFFVMQVADTEADKNDFIGVRFLTDEAEFSKANDGMDTTTQPTTPPTTDGSGTGQGTGGTGTTTDPNNQAQGGGATTTTPGGTEQQPSTGAGGTTTGGSSSENKAQETTVSSRLITTLLLPANRYTINKNVSSVKADGAAVEPIFASSAHIPLSYLYNLVLNAYSLPANTYYISKIYGGYEDKDIRVATDLQLKDTTTPRKPELDETIKYFNAQMIIDAYNDLRGDEAEESVRKRIIQVLAERGRTDRLYLYSIDEAYPVIIEAETLDRGIQIGSTSPLNFTRNFDGSYFA